MSALPLPSDDRIAAFLARHQPAYRYRTPHYQVQLLKDLAALIPAGDCRVLDIGAGNGLVGEAIAEFLPGKAVTGVDVAPRLLPTVRFPCAAYDGVRLPFADGAFDCALFCNVLHHVEPAVRPALLGEALRVTRGGPVVVKDHLARSALDRLRLAALDFVGNAPFGGMVRARYLSEADWTDLLSRVDGAREALPVSGYRSGLSALCFPNRLEICFSVRQSRSSAA
jgi:SAM-dependent methyltransferase